MHLVRSGRARGEYEIELRQDTSDNWNRADPVLRSGEFGYEKDTGKFKVGDGAHRWGTLPYYLPEPDLKALIKQAVDEAEWESGGGEAAMEALTIHINSATPHSVYDDGPSLLLLYQNAKV